MKKEINLVKAGEEISLHKNSPERLDSIQLNLAMYYAFYADQMIELELAKATFWEKHKDIKGKNPKSDPYLRALWLMTTEGKRMLEVDRTLSTIHILISSCKASLNRQSVEMRNQA